MIEEQVFVVAEKPEAARKIAEAIVSDSGSAFNTRDGIIDLPNSFNGKHYVICSALGHLYTLNDLQGNREIFPTLDIDWFSKSISGKSSFRKYSRLGLLIERRIRTISAASRGASKLVNACDLDSEGEAIGFNILEFACHAKRDSVWRAKFSTLTPEEIRNSFSSLHLADPILADAGRIRHLADFLWGINLSRALTVSASRTSRISPTNLTMGRVQGPTLSFVVDREIERLTHVPRPSWLLSCVLSKDGSNFA